jgi:predicted O-linked N-acetylglucosamine transferase (SPINDLY family)
MEETRFEEAFERVEALMAQWRLEEATASLEALRGAGGYPNRLRHDLSVLYAQQGFFHEALAEIEAALELEPDNRALWHHFLAIQKNNPRQPSAREWRAMHLAFGDTLRDRHDERHLAVARPEGGRLRVGLLCPDTHLATERFVWPLLERMEADAFEVFAYWAHAAEVDSVQRAYPRAQHRSLRGLDDAAVVSLVTADAIDVAVDIAGHGSANVLTALARRPAPVAVTWLDYLATTGMEEIDFRITDSVADPEGSEAAHVERLLRLDRAQWCYRPPQAGRETPVPPRANHAAPVFGAISVPLKLSDPLLELWARLLERVPGATLRLLGIPEGRARTRIRQRFTDRGIEAARLEFHPRLEQSSFFRALGEIDVALDTYPFSGATSTLDALWQGVPVVTLAGPLPHGRSTASILTALGRPEWIARSPDEFVQLAAALCLDRPRLQQERDRLRAHLAASPLCDGDGFAAGMSRALRQAWEARPRGRVDARQEATAFWQGVKAVGGAAGGRAVLADIADVVDVAGVAAANEGGRGWLLITHGGFFDPATLASTVSTDLLARYDVVAGLGADALANGDLLAAGQGHASGARIVAEGERLYISAWVPEGMGACMLVAGGALLVRRTLAAATNIGAATDAADFARHVARASHQLFRKGARLGVLPSLAVAERAWPAPASEWAAHRALERDLGLSRWDQERPAARAMKVVLARPGWTAIRESLDALLVRAKG